MNRELRRLQEREERRMRQAPRGPRRPARRPRTGILQFLREVRVELRKVAWPTRPEVVTYTVVALITTTTVALYAFALDVGFKELVLLVLQRG